VIIDDEPVLEMEQGDAVSEPVAPDAGGQGEDDE
jgi:hypothetical protein